MRTIPWASAHLARTGLMVARVILTPIPSVGIVSGACLFGAGSPGAGLYSFGGAPEGDFFTLRPGKNKALDDHATYASVASRNVGRLDFSAVKRWSVSLSTHDQARAIHISI